MQTFPMRQQDATKTQPFYSVAYQYERNPWTLYGSNHYDCKSGRTQSGTSNLGVAIEHAKALVTQPGIVLAIVSKTEDCYNHSEVFRANRN